MINICISLNRKNTRIFVLLMLFCVVGVLALFSAFIAQSYNAKTNEQRVEFIESLGISVISAPVEAKNVTIPQEFGDVYNNYNELQKSAGFNLELYKGCSVTVYTYKVTDSVDDLLVHLIVSQNTVIGGDICSAALGSQMMPLKNME